MTGSGSAFFKRCGTEREALAVTEALDCWSAVALVVGSWG
jgi:4-diphosphocytidyl-2C-methyl-D-erythritol kinase